MPLSITSTTRINGPACNHVAISVNHEGVTRTFSTSFAEIDNTLKDMTVPEQIQMLVILWAKYRRAQGRPVLNVEFA